MYLFKPTSYKKDIYSINYDKLKNDGISCLVFDLDNTLGLIDQKKCPLKTKKLLKKLQKDFLILINSNNTKKRLAPYLKELGVGGFHLGFKPSTRNLKKIKKIYKLKKNEMVMIGDQLITDICSGNRFRIKTILVDALGEKDLKITKLNRIIEDRIINKYKKLGIFERGKYYE